MAASISCQIYTTSVDSTCLPCQSLQLHNASNGGRISKKNMGYEDDLIRAAAFAHAGRLMETRDRTTDLAPGIMFKGELILQEKADCSSKK